MKASGLLAPVGPAVLMVHVIALFVFAYRMSSESMSLALAIAAIGVVTGIAVAFSRNRAFYWVAGTIAGSFFLGFSFIATPLMFFEEFAAMRWVIGGAAYTITSAAWNLMVSFSAPSQAPKPEWWITFPSVAVGTAVFVWFESAIFSSGTRALYPVLSIAGLEYLAITSVAMVIAGLKRRYDKITAPRRPRETV